MPLTVAIKGDRGNRTQDFKNEGGGSNPPSPRVTMGTLYLSPLKSHPLPLTVVREKGWTEREKDKASEEGK